MDIEGYLDREYVTSTKYMPALSTLFEANERLVIPSTEVLVVINGIVCPLDVTTTFISEQVGVLIPEGYARLTESFKIGRVTITGIELELMNAYAFGIA